MNKEFDKGWDAGKSSAKVRFTNKINSMIKEKKSSLMPTDTLIYEFGILSEIQDWLNKLDASCVEDVA